MLRRADWVVDPKRQMHDAVAQADALGQHGCCCQELFRTGHVGVAREKMVLYRPYGVEAQRIGQLDLF